MKTVTTIHLNGRAYQVEDGAHTALAAYLDKAAAALTDNPDKDEILADFEQAIAEKFSKYLTPQKNVITHAEIELIIAEMGPVNEPAEESKKSEEGTKDTAQDTQSSTQSTTPPKRLYRIKEGALIAGVCNGIAAYFDIDVVFVRAIFVIIGLISHGGGILGYFILMMILPKADTAEKMSHATGTSPLKAHEFIEQAKKNYAEFKGNKHTWKKELREQKKYWKYKVKESAHEMRDWSAQQNWSPVQETGTLIVRVILGIICAAITLAFLAAITILIVTGGIFFGFALPIGLPVWIAVIILLCAYNLVIWPLRLAFYPHGRRSRHYHQHHGDDWFDMWNGVMWMGLVAIFCWVMYHNIPFIHNVFDHLGHWITMKLRLGN